MHTIDEQPKRFVSMIVATGKNRVIGKGNELLWRIPDDMRRVKGLTVGHPVVMGRKTWDSIPEKFRPLSERTNIVVTRQNGFSAHGAVVVNSLQEALAAAANAPGSEEVFIFGGAQLYAEALPFTNRIYLTSIADEKEGDAFFPEYEHEFTKIIAREAREWNGLHYEWLTLER